MWVPLSIKKNKKNKRDQVVQNQEFVQRAERLVDFFYFFFLLKLISSIHGVPTVGFCRVKHEKCSTRQGVRVGTKNTGFCHVK